VRIFSTAHALEKLQGKVGVISSAAIRSAECT